MPIQDKPAAAKKIDELLKSIISLGGLRFKYRISANNLSAEEAQWDASVLKVELAGPDSSLLMERGGELMNSLEHLAAKALKLEPDEHELVSFDCRNIKANRRQELRLSAEVAAERVLKNASPYEFAPMNSRERRLVHLALSKHEELRTESKGEGPRRCVVVYPKDFKPVEFKPFGRRR